MRFPVILLYFDNNFNTYYLLFGLNSFITMLRWIWNTPSLSKKSMTSCSLFVFDITGFTKIYDAMSGNGLLLVLGLPNPLLLFQFSKVTFIPFFSSLIFRLSDLLFTTLHTDGECASS